MLRELRGTVVPRSQGEALNHPLEETNMNDLTKWTAIKVLLGILLFVIAWFNVLPTLNRQGTIHHGLVAQEICNGGTQSYVLINFNGTTRNYPVQYRTCLEFLYHHGQGVTITDSGAFDGIADYVFDVVKP
jgi:hypothetical protein